MPSHLLSNAWAKLAPVIQDLQENYPPDVLDIHALHFRGFNANPVDSPKETDEISLWINVGNKTFSSPLLLEKHQNLLREVWEEILNGLGTQVDRIMVAPPNGNFYIPGIYPFSKDMSGSMPIYQLMQN